MQLGIYDHDHLDIHIPNTYTLTHHRKRTSRYSFIAMWHKMEGNKLFKQDPRTRIFWWHCCAPEHPRPAGCARGDETDPIHSLRVGQRAEGQCVCACCACVCACACVKRRTDGVADGRMRERSNRWLSDWLTKQLFDWLSEICTTGTLIGGDGGSKIYIYTYIME